MERVVRLAQHTKRVALGVSGLSRSYALHLTRRCGSVPTRKDVRDVAALLTSILHHSQTAVVSRQWWIQVVSYRFLVVVSLVSLSVEGFI